MSMSVRLNDGNFIPQFGLGVYQVEPGQSTYSSVLCALKSGYRHIDTAALYRNEADVGRAIADSGIHRSEIFVTTKLWTIPGPIDYNSTMAQLHDSLKKLNLQYVDLYLIHSPNDKQNRLEQWRALESAKSAGLAKSIGVSNYGIHHLKELESVCTVPPATNQIEVHPWLTREALVAYCQSQGIVVTAYSPLAKARKMSDPDLLAIASKYKRTPAQSTKPERILENMDADFTLDPADLKKMNSWNVDMCTGWDPTKNP